jgi:hypothetical protein
MDLREDFVANPSSPWIKSDRAVRSGFGPDARSSEAPNTRGIQASGDAADGPEPARTATRRLCPRAARASIRALRPAVSVPSQASVPSATSRRPRTANSVLGSAIDAVQEIATERRLEVHGGAAAEGSAMAFSSQPDGVSFPGRSQAKTDPEGIHHRGHRGHRDGRRRVPRSVQPSGRSLPGRLLPKSPRRVRR